MSDDKNITSVPPVPLGVDDAVGVSNAKWFVAIVNSRHEKSVSEKLRQIGIDSYVATQTEVRVWANGRRKTVESVVISSMVFVHCTEEQRRQIVTLPYINRFLVNRSANSAGLDKQVAIISEAEMAKLKFMLGNSTSPVEFIPTEYRIHDNVRVVRGKLRGLEGEIRKTADGTHKLVVSLSLLGGASVFIDPADVTKLIP